MTLQVELYWSFRSPYSYLAAPRICELTQRYDLEVQFKPVLPIAVRNPDFFETVNPNWVAYLIKDVARLAEYHGIAYRWPRPDPIVMDLKTRRISSDQPYIYRLTRLGAAAAESGRGIEFMYEVAQVIWSGSVDNWHEGPHLRDAAERAGCNWPALDATVGSEAERLDQVLDQNRLGLEAAGHWGVPTMVFDGEPFFGQDRIDALVWRLKRKGLRNRQAR